MLISNQNEIIPYVFAKVGIKCERILFFMINFEYLAMWNDNSKQKWVISAPDEQQAIDNLHKLWLAVLKVTETSKLADTSIWQTKEKTLEWEEEYDLWFEEIIKFEFSWFDTNWEKTSWSIEANNMVTAYKRLIEEFYIDVEWIVDQSLPARLKDNKKKTSISDVIDLAYEQWVTIVSKTLSNRNTLSSGQDVTVSQEEQEQMQAEVETYIEKVNIFTSNNPDVFSSVEQSEIKKRKFELEKIKRSNNVFYIQSELNDLLDFIITKCTKEKRVWLKDTSSTILNDFQQYVWTKTWSVIYDKLLWFIGKYNIFKKFVINFEDKLVKELTPEIIQQKQRIFNYFKQLFYHLKSIFLTWWKERIKHMQITLKSWRLILSAYKTYFRLYWQYKQQKLMMTESLQKWYLRGFEEIREFTWWILMTYFIALVVFNISIVKWIIIPVTLSVTFINSKMLVSFIFLVFIINFALLIKIRYFSRSYVYNISSIFISVFLVFIYFNNY